MSICPAKINKWDTDGGVKVATENDVDDSSTCVLHSKTTTLSFDKRR